MTTALTTSAMVTLCALVALRPRLPRHSSPFNMQFALGYLINEQPFLGLLWLLLGTAGMLTRPEPGRILWWVAAGFTAVAVLVLIQLAVRARTAKPALSTAFESAFGPGAAPRFTRPPWWRIVPLPLVAWRPDVRRIRNQRYGPARRGHRLDLYASRRRHRPGKPVLVYVHGGAFRIGNKMLGARPLIYRLAARGWLCVSIDHRLLRVRQPDQLADVRAALEWVRAHARTYGADPDTLFLAGGSSGAYLAATVALTGAEVSGVIGLYGYYGEPAQPVAEPTSPHAAVNPAAPPFLIIHGAIDTLVLRTDAREFAKRLRAVSRQTVAYAELPGTQHNFDFFHSPRIHWVTDAVLRFAELAAGRASSGTPNLTDSRPNDIAPS